ncbi:potassium transporter [Candidatus Riesia sp. GBBU]|nr:potassium transporter [Candidatus Riesia sp. GBBU]ARC55074.1 potassium transporter [Candidatus Riesia sp. GBBU]
MCFLNVVRIIGMFLILFSFFMIFPLLISLIYKDGMEKIFNKMFLITLVIGLFLWIPNKNRKYNLNFKEGLLTVSLFWMILGSFGSIPFIFSKINNISITNAFFESFSGLTTTGATVLKGLSKIPRSVLFYRQMLQWLGGMGVIVLAIAIIPFIGTEGMQLYRAEITGPIKNEKIQPRISETAKTLWLMYILLTITCSIFLWISGMDIFDAISHSFSIVSVGGFSNYDENIKHFNSSVVECIIIIFLIISSCNFGLHFSVLSEKTLKIYWKNLEYKIFLIFQMVMIILCTSVLIIYSSYDSLLKTLRMSVFQVISTSTTAGFNTDNFFKWPTFLPILLLISSFVGGCSGSTTGGIKIIRIFIIFTKVIIEIKKLIHPNAVYSTKIGSKVFSEKIIENIWGFFSVYIFLFIINSLILISTGIDESSAFYLIISTLNNLGIEPESIRFSEVGSVGKWILIFSMLFGRLEIFTVLILFVPMFWKE